MGRQSTSKKFEELSSIPERLRWARVRKGLTVARLAELADVDKSYITKIEMGRTMNPSADVALRLSGALGLDYRWLAWGQQRPFIDEEAEKVDAKHWLGRQLEGLPPPTLDDIQAAFLFVTQHMDAKAAGACLHALWDHKGFGEPLRRIVFDSLYNRAWSTGPFMELRKPEKP